MKNNLFNDLKFQFFLLNKLSKIRFFILIFLMFVSACFEAIGIGLLYPFVQALLDVNRFISNWYVVNFFQFFNFNLTPNNIIFFFCFVFIFITFISVIFRIFVVNVTSLFTFKLAQEIYLKIFDNYLSNFDILRQDNSSNISSVLTQKIDSLIYGIFLPLLTISSSILMLVFIISLLLFFKTKIVLIGAFTIIFLYLVVIFIVKKNLNSNSKKIAFSQNFILKNIKESNSLILNIFLDNKKRFFINKHKKLGEILMNSKSNSFQLSLIPKFFLEFIFILLVSIYFIYSYLSGSFNESLPFIAIAAYSFQKIFPIAFQIYASYTNLLTHSASLNMLIKNQIDSKPNTLKKFEKISSFHSISLKHLTFSYPNSKNNLIKNFSLSIKKGEFVAIKGFSGRGKSTLVKLILGIIHQNKGDILINNINKSTISDREYNKLFAYAQQQTPILDASIAENIALDTKFNISLIKNTLKICELENHINKLSKKYRTILLEDGKLFSGGQLQRIGIARALYKNSEIIILDESFAGIDNPTSIKILKNIKKKYNKKTIIIISHNPLICNLCDRVIQL